jgi:hypothetical protein
MSAHCRVFAGKRDDAVCEAEREARPRLARSRAVRGWARSSSWSEEIDCWIPYVSRVGDGSASALERYI